MKYNFDVSPMFVEMIEAGTVVHTTLEHKANNRTIAHLVVDVTPIPYVDIEKETAVSNPSIPLFPL